MGDADGLTCCKEENPAAENSVLPPPQGVVLEPEIVRPVAGLGKFEHDPVTVVGVAGNNRKAVVVLGVQLQVLFVNLGNLFHADDALAVDDGHVQGVFQIFVDGVLGDLSVQAGGFAFSEIVVI